MQIPISILILTKNEERDLPGCLESIRWSDDIHLYDSYSEDSTVGIAQKFGAKITQRSFDNWSAHQNWGLANIPFKYEWVFYIDADERVHASLIESIGQAINNPSQAFDAYRIQRRDFFMGAWLKHVQTTPYYIRLFRPQKIRYERLVNPVTIVDGSIGQLTGYLDHFPFSKGVGHWLDRHNSYSTFEAQQIYDNQINNETFNILKAFTAKNFQSRRYHQKELFYRLPARPLIKFFILYFLKRGFLDGKPGFTYAVLQSIYEYTIILKVDELKNRELHA
ncbi:glycosyltransferase family 2 protein [Altericista sp. CCNU0014]|uniref:glycosyltransferase family 2 protein n=1 Tax=Altericista sp. CCNU0014 TaxID=3082949 RepID=UPI00384E1059